MDYYLWFILHAFLLSGLYGATSSLDVASEKSCLTWQDDKEWFNLICRFKDFDSPLTFVHDESKREMKCQNLKDTTSCTPNGNFTIDADSKTVTLAVSKNKHGQWVEGTWYCKQGSMIHSTIVSLSEGTMIDVSITLRGTVEVDTNKLHLECSSCRKPKNLYTEILINGRTDGSFQQTEKDCWYNNVLCSISKICQCTARQNAFLLAMPLSTIGNGKNISCYMQFYDGLRETTFSIMVNHTFENKDFEIKENETKVIYSNQDMIQTTRHSNAKDPTFSSTTNTATIHVPTIQDNTLVVIVVGVVMAILTLGSSFGVFYVFCGLRIKKNKEKYKSNDVTIEEKEILKCIREEIQIQLKQLRPRKE